MRRCGVCGGVWAAVSGCGVCGGVWAAVSRCGECGGVWACGGVHHGRVSGAVIRQARERAARPCGLSLVDPP
jgi:hypothetical protein